MSEEELIKKIPKWVIMPIVVNLVRIVLFILFLAGTGWDALGYLAVLYFMDFPVSYLSFHFLPSFGIIGMFLMGVVYWFLLGYGLSELLKYFRRRWMKKPD